METKTLYEKVGRKYIPVAEYECLDYMREGVYTIVVRPGLRTIFRKTWPHLSDEWEAALKMLADKMAKAMCEKSASPVAPKEMTPKQKKAWDAFVSAFKTDRAWLPSKVDIAEAGASVIADWKALL